MDTRRRLLEGACATDIDVVLDDGRNEAADRPDVVRIGQKIQDFARHHGLVQHGGRVEQRRFARHGHRLLHPVHLHRQVSARCRLGVDGDVLDGDGTEAGQLASHGVPARHQARELVCAARIGHRHLITANGAWVGQGDRHARQNRAGCVEGRAGDRPEAALRMSQRRHA